MKLVLTALCDASACAAGEIRRREKPPTVCPSLIGPDAVTALSDHTTNLEHLCHVPDGQRIEKLKRKDSPI